MAIFDDIQETADAFTLEVFGDPVTYTTRAGDSYTLTCVLDSGTGVQDSEKVYYTAWAPLASFQAEPVKGDRVTIGSQQFMVRDIDKDHETGRKLKLSATSPA